jgi:hypothetical protein
MEKFLLHLSSVIELDQNEMAMLKKSSATNECILKLIEYKIIEKIDP